jgi:hypothetical protein
VSTAVEDVFNELGNFTELQQLRVRYLNHINISSTPFVQNALQNVIGVLRHSLREIDLQGQIERKANFGDTLGELFFQGEL